ncbi:MAG: hypothetical protein A2939_03800 [Parcubacteria group bacterium RIFCSPLOWO2_01_FULL_48_18]|nr:MAG: hypothetical protein A2939_03800 [Parcubacteria group bacterium RIFCSPLOWO2_01_FULL_48_18]
MKRLKEWWPQWKELYAEVKSVQGALLHDLLLLAVAFLAAASFTFLCLPKELIAFLELKSVLALYEKIPYLGFYIRVSAAILFGVSLAQGYTLVTGDKRPMYVALGVILLCLLMNVVVSGYWQRMLG